MQKIKNKSALIISILIPIAIGALSALISNNMEVYQTLNKPPLSPPSITFPIVWTILFILMGISSYIIYMSNSKGKNTALKIYGIQLFFNFCWSIIFFALNQYLFAFIWLLILIALIIIMIIKKQELIWNLCRIISHLPKKEYLEGFIFRSIIHRIN